MLLQRALSLLAGEHR